MNNHNLTQIIDALCPVIPRNCSSNAEGATISSIKKQSRIIYTIIVIFWLFARSREMTFLFLKIDYNSATDFL